MYQLCIVCPHRLIREALRELVWRSSATVVGEGRNLLETLDGLDAAIAPDLLVFNLDFGLNSEAELEQIFEARRRLPSAKIVVLTGDPTLETSLRAVRAGVNALLSRDIPGDIFQKALHFVMLGQILLPEALGRFLLDDVSTDDHEIGVGFEDPEISGASIGALVAPAMVAQEMSVSAAPTSVGASNLSGRESQILQCLVKGSSNKFIARQLNLAEATVKVHIKSVLRKLKAANRTQAAVWALNNRPALERLPDDFAPVEATSVAPAQRLECGT